MRSAESSFNKALVGDKTLTFWLMNKDMYDYMSEMSPSVPTIDRGSELQKIIPLFTHTFGGDAWLNFVGTEQLEDNAWGTRNERDVDETSTSNDFILNVSQPPTLKRMSKLAFAIKLCTEHDIVNYIEEQSVHQLSFLQKSSKFVITSCFVSLKVKILEKLKASLPNSMIEKVCKTANPILRQVIEYVLEKKREPLIMQNTIERGILIQWTMGGVIDKAATLKTIVKNENYIKNSYNLFKLACKYCMKEVILDLWKDNSESFNNIFLNFKVGYEEHLLMYWILLLKTDMSLFKGWLLSFDKNRLYKVERSIYANMLTSSIFLSNIYAVKYFWSHLTYEEKCYNIEFWLAQCFAICDVKPSEYQCYDAPTEILCYLLCKQDYYLMYKEKLVPVYFKILRCLFNVWPLQRVFFTAFQILFPYLPAYDFAFLIRAVANKLCEDRTLEKFLLKIWLFVPLSSKQLFFQDVQYCSTVIYKFLLFDSQDMIKLMLNNASSSEKRMIVLNMKDRRFISPIFLLDLVLADKLKSFDSFLSDYLILDYDIISFKRQIMIEMGYSVFLSLLGYSFHSSKNFLKWGFHSVDDIQTFKKIRINTTEVQRILVKNEQYSDIDLFRSWYFGCEEQ